MTQPSLGQPHLVPGATQILLPSPEAEMRLTIRRSEWRSLCARVGRMANPVPNIKAWGQTFVGAAVGGVLAIIPWVPAYSAMGRNLRLRFNWVWVVLIAFAALFTILAIFCLWVAKKFKDVQVESATLIAADMERIERDLTPTTAHPPAGSSASGLTIDPVTGMP